MRAQIDVGYNNIDQAASLELIAAMKGKSMVSIGMGRCKLGVEGAKAMAELISVTASLTECKLGALNYNFHASDPSLDTCRFIRNSYY